MLNLDLSTYNPVQNDSQFANVPLPSAHLVVIEESELKASTKDGFSKGTNLVLELTILASSCGNEYTGQKLGLFIPYEGYDDNVIAIGMRRLSTLAHTLGVGSFLQTKEQLHGQNFIVVLDKQKEKNFADFKRILNAQGMELADSSGNFKPCELKSQPLQAELDKLLIALQGGGQAQAQTQGFAQPNQSVGSFTQPNTFEQQQTAQTAQVTQQFTPNTNFGGAVEQQPQQQQQVQQQQFQQQQQPNFGATQQQPNFGGQAQTPNWGQSVNTNNGQTA